MCQPGGETDPVIEVTFVSDEKEQVLYPIALDRYYGRQVRYLEPLTAGGRFPAARAAVDAA
jgi:hypothetical protein